MTAASIEDFVAAEVLSPGDATITARLAHLAGESEPLALLGLAFTVRAVRHGSTCFDPLDDPGEHGLPWPDPTAWRAAVSASRLGRDRKSTRLNSSHVKNSYAVLCLKKQ